MDRLSVKELKAYLVVRGVSIIGITERHELVEAARTAPDAPPPPLGSTASSSSDDATAFCVQCRKEGEPVKHELCGFDNSYDDESTAGCGKWVCDACAVQCACADACSGRYCSDVCVANDLSMTCPCGQYVCENHEHLVAEDLKGQRWRDPCMHIECYGCRARPCRWCPPSAAASGGGGAKARKSAAPARKSAGGAKRGAKRGGKRSRSRHSSSDGASS